jgi:hypothetical protein
MDRAMIPTPVNSISVRETLSFIQDSFYVVCGYRGPMLDSRAFW